MSDRDISSLLKKAATRQPQHCGIMDDGRLRQFESIPLTAFFTDHVPPDARNDALVERGYARGIDNYSRNACPSCDLCKPCRVNLEFFRISGNQQRVIRRNADLTVEIVNQYHPNEHLLLLRQHLIGRGLGFHKDLDRQDTIPQIVNSLGVFSSIMEVRDPEQRLIGAMLFDRLENGVIARTHYYATDPAAMKRGMGTFLILKLIGHAQILGKSYLYLDIWNPDARPLAYKSRFKPLEVMEKSGEWRPLEP